MSDLHETVLKHVFDSVLYNVNSSVFKSVRDSLNWIDRYSIYSYMIDYIEELNKSVDS